MVVDRGALGSQHARRLLDRLRSPGAAGERVLGRARAYRDGGDAAEADARAAHDPVVQVERERHCDAGDVVVAALGDLLERRRRRERQRDADRADQLVRGADALR